MNEKKNDASSVTRACSEATRLFESGDAKGALKALESVPADDLRPGDRDFKRRMEEIVSAERELTALVKESKADGVLDPDEVVSMWQATFSYLRLNPRHEKIAELQQQLEARIQKAPAKYASFSELADFWPAQPESVLSQLLSPAELKKYESLKDGATRLTLDVAQRFLADPESTYLFDYETIELDAAEALAKHTAYLFLNGLTGVSLGIAMTLPETLLISPSTA